MSSMSSHFLPYHDAVEMGSSRSVHSNRSSQTCRNRHPMKKTPNSPSVLSVFLLFGVYTTMLLVSKAMDPACYQRRDILLQYSSDNKEKPSPLGEVPKENVSSAKGSGSGGATGILFTGEKIRKYQGQQRFANMDNISMSQVSDDMKAFPRMSRDCDKWGVVTTINAPSLSVKRMASLQDWCLVVVADTQTPATYMDANDLNKNKTIFLSVKDQARIDNEFVRRLPFKSFARKNIGYLFAIRHGAQVIYDFDDDNVLKTRGTNDTHAISPFSTKKVGELSGTVTVRYLQGESKSDDQIAFNPLPAARPTTDLIWPRGFPLDLVSHQRTVNVNENGRTWKEGTISMSSVGVIQSVCDEDPDVDAIFRLTRELPIRFDSSEIASNIMVPPKSYAPYNAQATTHMYSAFWGLLLPFTVTGRVSDIWRSYFSQRLFLDLGLSLIYSPPLVTHIRSAHNYLADLQAENDLNLKSHSLLRFLSSWSDDAPHIQTRIENLAIELFERCFIEEADVEATIAWLTVLGDIGYVFPRIPLSNEIGTSIITLNK